MRNNWHVATAAEAFAAAQFARCGWDVSVQYGANQPEYDLLVTTREGQAECFVKVSVKGSKDGSWGLTQSYLANANYHGAVDDWLGRHGPSTIFCFVQFKGTSIGEMPRMYLATPQEVAARLKATAGGRGDTILYERHRWGPRAQAAGTLEEIPSSWAFTDERLSEILAAVAGRGNGARQGAGGRSGV